MIDKDTYKRELIRMWDSVRVINKGGQTCMGVICDECQLHGFKYGCKSLLSTVEVYGAVLGWSEDHPPKKFKVSKLEYDIIRAAIDYSSEEEAFKDVDILYELLINGYFQGATRDMTINYYFDNCEVEHDR